MIEINWRCIRDIDLTEDERRLIAELKDQHWTYGLPSQFAWMTENIKKEDCHLMGFNEEGHLLAYLTLNYLSVTVDGFEVEIAGVGGVCVEKTKMRSGLGKRLIDEANRIITQKRSLGMLLCQEQLVSFYEKCFWHVLPAREVTVCGKPYAYIVMTYPNIMKYVQQLSIPRNF